MNADLIAVSLRTVRDELDRVDREREILQRISLGYQDLLMLRDGPAVTVTEEPPALLEGPREPEPPADYRRPVGLGPISEARAWKAERERRGLTQAAFAAELGYSQPAYSKRERLLDLPEATQADVESGALGVDAAYEMVATLSGAEPDSVAAECGPAQPATPLAALDDHSSSAGTSSAPERVSGQRAPRGSQPPRRRPDGAGSIYYDKHLGRKHLGERPVAGEDDVADWEGAA